MSSNCDQVAERIALGEPLGEAGEHAATCERCKRLVALPVELGSTRREVDPGLGFSARMTAGAQQRILVRRRWRMAGMAASAVAVVTLGVFAFTREPELEKLAETPARRDHQLPATRPSQDDPWDANRASDETEDAEDVRALVQLANTDRSSKLSANWRRIKEPLAPYRSLLRGISHE